MADEPDILSDRENDSQWVQDDGTYSPELEQCVKDFQAQQQLVVDGWVGPRTRCVLNREGVVIDLDQFPKLKELAQIGDNVRIRFSLRSSWPTWSWPRVERTRATSPPRTTRPKRSSN